jgi:hypothetical protein
VRRRKIEREADVVGGGAELLGGDAGWEFAGDNELVG